MTTISYVFGGIGIFLLGMFLLTSGLKALAGKRLKKLLKKFVGGKISSILSGFVVTTAVQSSSATTLMTIGFVSAGLITFSQSIGLILGANLGSTTTGWIVSLLGVKFKILTIALPFIGLGAFLKFSKKENFQLIGQALAGFGLIFVGIDVLQQGMGDLTGIINLRGFDNGIWGSVLLLFIGILMVLIMQSSGATMAMTITALYAEAIAFEHAMILVIGQNIGTTATALLGAVGATITAKRTAFAHALFNITTGILVFLSLPLFINLIKIIEVHLGIVEEATQLAVFHSLFNIVGIVLIYPFIKNFAKFIEKILPEKQSDLTHRLDENLTQHPGVAIEAVKKTVIDIKLVLNGQLKEILQGKPLTKKKDVELAINRTSTYLNQLDKTNGAIDYEIYVPIIHSLDHMRRLLRAMSEKENSKLNHINEIKEEILQTIVKIENNIKKEENEFLIETTKKLSEYIALTRKDKRKETLKNIAENRIKTEEGITKIEEIMWVDRIAYHIWRMTEHIIKKH